MSSAHGLILMTKILVSKFMESNQEDEEEGINNPVAVGYLNKALYILNDATQKDEMKQVRIQLAKLYVCQLCILFVQHHFV